MSAELSAPTEAEAVERLAARVAELLEPRLVEALEAKSVQLDTAGPLVDAATVADTLGLTRSTVYARADELGAIRLGDGPKPRLRFDLERARSAWRGSGREPAPEPRRQPTHRRRYTATRSSAELLPIRSRQETP